MLGGSLTQRAVRSCGQCGEMPLKIMLNVRDTQTHSSRRLVPLSTAKPIYCNTRVRSIKVHTHTHAATHPACRQENKEGRSTPPFPFHSTSQAKKRPTQASGAAAGSKTQTDSIPRQTQCKKCDWFKRQGHPSQLSNTHGGARKGQKVAEHAVGV